MQNAAAKRVDLDRHFRVEAEANKSSSSATTVSLGHYNGVAFERDPVTPCTRQ